MSRGAEAMWMRGAVAGWLCAGSFAALLCCGCGGQAGMAESAYRDNEPLPPDTMTVAMPEIGRHGGRFVIAETSPPRTFNAILANETSSTDITDGRLFTSLAEYDNATQEDTPALARSWERSADGLTTTFHLRRGARFSDGHPITSDDVLFSVAVVMDSVLHPSVQDLLKAGGRPFEFSAPDSYTVVVKTAAPAPLIVALAGAVRIMPRHVLEPALRAGTFAAAYGVSTRPESLVTSGPWRLKEYLPGEKVVLTRNPYWFGVDASGQRLPYLDELVYLVVPDQEAASLKFLAGEVDGLDNVKPEDYGTYERQQKEKDFTLYSLGPSLTTSFFWFNLNTVQPNKTPAGRRVGDPYVAAVKYAWFRNREFRRAISKAINRDDIIQGPYHGFGIKNWSTTTAGNRQWFSADVKGTDYDPEGAKKILAGLGFRDRNGDGFLEDPRGNPVRFTIKTNSDSKVRMALLGFIQNDLAKVGVKAVPAGVDFNTLITNFREDFQYEAGLLGLTSGVPPDPGMSGNVFRSSGPTHWWSVRQVRPGTPAEAKLDQLMNGLASTLDPAERKKIWLEMESIVNEECLLVWLPTQVQKLPIRNRFGNLQPSIIPHRILWNIDRVYVKKPPNARA